MRGLLTGSIINHLYLHRLLAVMVSMTLAPAYVQAAQIIDLSDSPGVSSTTPPTTSHQDAGPLNHLPDFSHSQTAYPVGHLPPSPQASTFRANGSSAVVESTVKVDLNQLPKMPKSYMSKKRAAHAALQELAAQQMQAQSPHNRPENSVVKGDTAQISSHGMTAALQAPSPETTPQEDAASAASAPLTPLPKYIGGAQPISFTLSGSGTRGTLPSGVTTYMPVKPEDSDVSGTIVGGAASTQPATLTLSKTLISSELWTLYQQMNRIDPSLWTDAEWKQNVKSLKTYLTLHDGDSVGWALLGEIYLLQRDQLQQAVQAYAHAAQFWPQRYQTRYEDLSTLLH